MVAEDEVSDEQVTFTKMEEAYKAVIDNDKMTKSERWADAVFRTLQHERVVKLVTQRTSLHKQVREILDRVKEDLEKVEVTQSREALKTQRELLTKTERRI